ncbi:DUF6284 family protein [Streptomyces tropicalis]|uniref:DUF6284 family protein n=1 Tax=Streptomyces tropicalis TaxID=3034234 RepID=A0ABT6A696_9ACTN|nr:DUF6284 family protein [Streptomyces tropicalis]MDF3299988.1 DUF6284 family protein [Streptomyces tropicalis]
MEYIGAVQAVVTAAEYDREPTAAELDAIDAEMPLISAEVELLDVRIALMDRPANPLATRRLRRAEHRVMAARRDLANRGGAGMPEVA